MSKVLHRQDRLIVLFTPVTRYLRALSGIKIDCYFEKDECFIRSIFILCKLRVILHFREYSVNFFTWK